MPWIPEVRRLVADAAVLGTTFPAEALIAVSGRDEPSVRAALADLVRREVLSVSADPLSPERGSYRFAQQMLRQVAYDTLSRRDRKARHLTVAAHLRAAFAGDGEEVADVIARHYLDALHALPDDPDAAQIRGQAVIALIRAAERAERTGAPALAAASYATAAELSRAARHRRPATSRPGCCGNAPRRPPSPMLTRPRPSSMRSAPAIITCGAVRPGPPPEPRPSPGGRCAPGAVTPRHANSSPRPWRCCGQIPTPTPLMPWSELAALEAFAGLARRRPAHAPRCSSSARPSASAPASSAACSSPAGSTSAPPSGAPRRSPTSTKPRGSPPRPATTSGVGRALINLSDALAVTDPAAAAEAARTAAGHLRRAGDRRSSWPWRSGTWPRRW